LIPIEADFHVLCVEMEKLLLKLTQRAGGVHVLKDEVGRVRSQTKVFDGMSLKARADDRVVIRFLPPGHSSFVNDIGQFSMPTLIP